LEELLEEVIDRFDVGSLPTPAVDSSRKRAFIFSDSPPSLGTVSGSDSEDIEAPGQGNWMRCCKCNEPRLVPRWQILTFQVREAKFFCRFVGAVCLLTKRRRRQ